jgi:hypothetical protein
VLALLLALMLTGMFASLLTGLSFNSGFGLAAVLGAVVGATFAVGSLALLAAHALVGAGAVHNTVVLALLGGNGAAVIGRLVGLVGVVAGDQGEHSHSGHCGKQNLFHCFDVLLKLVNK